MSTNVDPWNKLLVDKVIFLIGDAEGVARYIARACYIHGARLVLGDLNIDAFNKIKEEILEKKNNDDN